VPGVRRRLRDVTKKVTGALTGSPAEPVEDEPAVDARTPQLQEDIVVTAPPPAPVEPGPAVEPETSGVDARCAEAVDLARAAASEVAGAAVGEHLGVEVDPADGGGHVLTHAFATTDPAYVGWRWAVTVARAEGSDVVTVDEVVLLPGRDALLAPPWVPWSERVQPGDLGAGDLLPPTADDLRLVPAYADVDAERLPFDLHRELGLGRPRVLSRDGRADAAERWYEGEPGPDTPAAQAAPGRCRDCGFFVPLAGALGRVFGACANGMAPDDGRVVALTHGCGAHSETVVEQPESSYAGMAVVHEELDEFELVDVRPDTVVLPVEEPTAEQQAAEEASIDALAEVVLAAAPADEVAADEVAVDEVAADEVAVDEVAADEAPTAEVTDDEVAAEDAAAPTAGRS